MKQRCLFVLLMVCGLAAADPERDLKFAQKLAARGLKEMALEVLDKLERSSDPAAARAGRFGKAQLTKYEATRARNLYMFDLAAAAEPRVTRDAVLALYKDAAPKVEDYVKNRPGNHEARFLLGELLQEYAEFLTGASYPETMAEERAKLVSKHKDEASDLFEKAIDSFEKVSEVLKDQVAKDAPLDDPDYVRMTVAAFNKGLARFRWASIYPKGPNFQHRVDAAVEELDEFLQEHFDEAAGAYAMIYLGRCYYEKAVRLGDADEGEVAINYFEMVYTEVEERPAAPQTFDILGQAFYWYAKTCNALAQGLGNLKKPAPIFFQNTFKAENEIRQRVKHGAKHPMVLRALLEIADAHALQRRYDHAVGLAGEVLATARVEGHVSIGKLATVKLTSWVASVSGSGALEPELLFQIGASLAAQGRTGNAITFYEKAMAASVTEAQKEKIGYPAQLEVARAYRRDKRFYAGAAVAWGLVEGFLKSGAESDSDFGLTASEACNQARLCWRTISDQTRSAADSSRYQEILNTFRAKFPAHRENSDAAFGSAIELFTRRKYEQAALSFRDINPSSPNYWRAQRRVPQCYRILAQTEKNEAKARKLHEQTLASARRLKKLAEGKSDDRAKKGLQYGRLYEAMALSALGQWKEAVAAADLYLREYPGKFVKHGLELKIKVDAHRHLGQLDEAEAALKELQQKEPTSPYIRGLVVDLYTALKAAYKPMSTGKKRKAMAGRAADLWEQHLKGQDEAKLSEGDYFALGEAMRDGSRYKEAGEAFDMASGMVHEDKRPYFKLQAAEMTFKAAKEDYRDKRIDKKEYLKLLKKTRALFTDVLIPDRSKQEGVLKVLADYKKYPQRVTFSAIKRRPQVLLTTAEVYNESTTKGTDSRWIAVRLIDYLHSFTRATSDPANPKLAELVPYWWKGAELKLKIFLEIMRSGGDAGRAGKNKGYAFARKITFQYSKMDGPERVERINKLKEELK